MSPVMTIKEIAETINARAGNYRMGKFQEIRKDLHSHIKKTQTKKIFSAQTIFETYAFHSGGRTELQYNIGFDKDEYGNRLIRHGVAFSLERSQTLPSIELLFPKMDRFNAFICHDGHLFADMAMWSYWHDQRSKNEPPVIKDELRKNHIFIFFGKYQPIDEINIDTILQDFDRLLILYKSVERQEHSPPGRMPKFEFYSGHTPKKSPTSANYIAQRLDIEGRHNELHQSVYDHLCIVYGPNRVGTENQTGSGGSIDIVLRDGSEYIIFEIKTSPDVRFCIRDALPQLLEYAYWPGGCPAKELIIVAECELTEDAREYLRKLRVDYSIPIYYQRFDSSTRKLLERV